MSTSIVTGETGKIGEDEEPSQLQSRVQIIWDLDQLAPDKKATKANVWINDELVRIADDLGSIPLNYYDQLSPGSLVKIELYSNLQSFQKKDLKLHFIYEGKIQDLHPTQHKAKLEGEIQSGDLTLFQNLHTVIGRICRIY